MLLSQSMAMQIVGQLSKVIEQNINIMDIKGTIISSTDPARIGTLHGGAVRILSHRLPELIIERDDEYEGTRPGINLPIQFMDQIIGVIGLTGRSEEVRRYGQIIKKMTEVLIRDTYLREQQNSEQMARDRFLEEWVFGKYEINHPKEFRFRAEALGIDIESPKRIIVISVKTKENQPVSEEHHISIHEDLLHLLQPSKQQYFFRTSTLYILVLNQTGEDELMILIFAIKEMIESKHLKVFMGIDSNEVKPLRLGFRNANIALKVSQQSKKCINTFSLLNLDVAIGSLSDKDKENFLEQLFPNTSHEEIVESLHMIKVFYDCEGSLAIASERLFIHKNTLQYRLNKVGELTGYDPRKINQSYLFSVAIQMLNSLTNL